MQEVLIKITQEREYFERVTEGSAFFVMQNPGTLTPETILNAKWIPTGWKTYVVLLLQYTKTKLLVIYS